MRPYKAVLFFVYGIAALAAVGTALSHCWRNGKFVRQETKQLNAFAATAPAAGTAVTAP